MKNDMKEGGIPRRYTEKQWKKLTQKESKGIPSIFKKVGLLISVMVGVALAVSALYSSSGAIGLNGHVNAATMFEIEVFDTQTQQWESNWTLNEIEITSGQTEQYNIRIRWTDNTTCTQAKCLGCHLENSSGLSACHVNIVGQILNEGQAYDIILSLTASGQAYEPITGSVLIDFEIIG